MSDISGAQVGGLLGDIDNVQARLDAAGAASGQHASDASGSAQRLVDEVGDVTAVLSSTFGELAEALREQIRAARDTLASADWSGRSRGAAEAAEAQLYAQVDMTVERAQVGVGELSTQLRGRVLAFHEEVAGHFSTVMNSINESYAGLASGTAAFAANLAEADQTIQFSG